MSFRAIPAFIQVLNTSFGNIGTAVHIAWPWFILLGPLGAFTTYASLLGGPPHGAVPPASTLLTLVYLACNVVCGASIAVNWHRFLLLGEVAQGAERLRLDSLVWRYVGNALLLGLLFTLVLAALILAGGIVVVVGSMHAPAGSAPEFPEIGLAGYLAIVAAAAVPGALLLRWGIKFPAIALGRDGYGFRDGWRDSKGHFLPIIGFTLMLSIALHIPTYMINKVLLPAAETSSVLLVIYGLVHIVWNFAVTITGITTLTLLYAIFVEGADL